MNKKLKLLTLFILINLNCSLKAIEPKKIATTAAMATAISASATIGGCWGIFNRILEVGDGIASEKRRAIFLNLLRINATETTLYTIGITAAICKNKEVLSIVAAYLIAKNSLYTLFFLGK